MSATSILEDIGLIGGPKPQTQTVILRPVMMQRPPLQPGAQQPPAGAVSGYPGQSQPASIQQSSAQNHSQPLQPVLVQRPQLNRAATAPNITQKGKKSGRNSLVMKYTEDSARETFVKQFQTIPKKVLSNSSKEVHRMLIFWCRRQEKFQKTSLRNAWVSSVILLLFW